MLVILRIGGNEMRKRMKRLGLCFLICLMLLPGIKVQAKDDFTKAVWISYLDFQTYLKDKNQKEFKKAFEEMCETAVDHQLDTLIVHVRAFNDAIYPTDDFMVADWLSSDQKLDYDALEIMIDIAHEYDLKFEAWINPYRVSLTSEQSKRFMNSDYADDFDEDDLIAYTSGADQRIILNPASKTVQRHITAGVKEIVENYDVDGIHFDDYFYQTGTLGNTTPEERREHVNDLVQRVYKTIKRIDKDVVFGISPQGNLDNDRYEGADIDTWLSKDGYVDYVMPQIYWTDQYGDGSITMFTNRMKQFQTLWTNKNVELKVGLGLYMVERKPSSDPGWSLTSDNIAKQIEKAVNADWTGFSVFRYADLLKTVSSEEVKNMIAYLESISNNAPEEPEQPEKPKSEWYLVDGHWWYRDEVYGEYPTMWKASFTDWYFVMNGKMVTSSWIARDASGDIWYYVDKEGKMVTNTIIDGYVINSYGEWHRGW